MFEYDFENQLTNVYVASAWRSEFKYDAFGRKRVQKEYTWNSGLGTWNLTNEVRYVYDGMLVVQERDANNLALVSYTRGNDLSGTLQGAGGIGGLLARSELANLQSPHAYYHADGNGNVTAMVDTNGFVVARYNYDPYGNLLGMSGPMAEANTYRFSSKEWCANAGLYYYGYRFYEPDLQRWLNRDPIKEAGGINLFSPALNDLANLSDPFGLSWKDKCGSWVKDLLRGKRAKKGAVAQSTDDAVRLAKEGEEFVIYQNKDDATEAAAELSNGKKPKYEKDKKTGAAHFHPADRDPRVHFLWKKDIAQENLMFIQAAQERRNQQIEDAFDFCTDFLPGGELGGVLQDAVDDAKARQNQLNHGINPDGLKVYPNLKCSL